MEFLILREGTAWDTSTAIREHGAPKFAPCPRPGPCVTRSPAPFAAPIPARIQPESVSLL